MEVRRRQRFQTKPDSHEGSSCDEFLARADLGADDPVGGGIEPTRVGISGVEVGGSAHLLLPSRPACVQPDSISVREHDSGMAATPADIVVLVFGSTSQ